MTFRLFNAASDAHCVSPAAPRLAPSRDYKRD
jgi:hypothetical protein